MNEIESTIDYIKTNYEKLNIGIDYSNGKDHTTIMLFDKQAELVIKTLQEKLEREKGCEYCRERKPILSELGILQIDDTDNTLWFTCQTTVDDIYDEHTKINYCFNCGRKLGENNG